jgi:6-phosphogluconate dehydrogenase
MGQSVIGLVGLGTMGANLALNIAEKGHDIAVWNRSTDKTRAFHESAGALQGRITPCETLAELAAAIRPPRDIIVMVNAGAPVDETIAALLPVLGPDDGIIDAGNAEFHDTNRRAAVARAEGRPFLGIGVSGGESGARHGPSIMGGGPKPAWDRVAPVLTAIAARYDGTPCATWMGEDGAGHFVKMVHNGIEYADMQMIAEVYGIMRDGMGLDAAAIADVLANWNRGPLESYLIEISAEVAGAIDPDTHAAMLDVILDRAGQKGTGRWTVIEAQHLATPISAIEAAVSARNMSARLDLRRQGEALFGAAPQTIPAGNLTPGDLEQALIAGKIMCYAQGFDMLAAASASFGWNLPLPDIARVWRAGCIIRSTMLNDMARALAEDAGRNLLFAPHFAGLVRETQGALRKVVAACASHGIPVPALSAGRSYFDMLRSSRSTANMIQGQRDFFGAHGFERTDRSGSGYHGPWGQHG